MNEAKEEKTPTRTTNKRTKLPANYKHKHRMQTIFSLSVFISHLFSVIFLLVSCCEFASILFMRQVALKYCFAFFGLTGNIHLSFCSYTSDKELLTQTQLSRILSNFQ